MSCNLYTNLTQAYERLISFSRLEFNWDSVGANTIHQQAIDNASSFLNYVVTRFTPYQVNPLPSGRVEMRWKGEDYDLVLEFTRKSRIIYNLAPNKEGLCFENGVIESMEEAFHLLLLCLRKSPAKESKRCDTKCEPRHYYRDHHYRHTLPY